MMLKLCSGIVELLKVTCSQEQSSEQKEYQHYPKQVDVYSQLKVFIWAMKGIET